MPIVATAGWSIPKTVADRFPAEGSGLSRYAAVFPGVEINSTFYRRHRPSTFERWAASVPDGFRFSVKLPREITHEGAMRDVAPLFDRFLADIAPLGAKRGPLLCQLPPSLAFDAGVMDAAFTAMRRMDEGSLAVEARHRSWASPEALALLAGHGIDRVLADPAPVWPAEAFPEPPRYIRLHGSPRIYYSPYAEADIAAFAGRLAPDGWCVFDNTASGAAIENALAML